MLNSTEAYNMVSDKWQKSAPMIQARTGFSFTRIKEYILVAGGLSEYNNNVKLLDSVEKFDTRTEQ